MFFLSRQVLEVGKDGGGAKGLRSAWGSAARGDFMEVMEAAADGGSQSMMDPERLLF